MFVTAVCVFILSVKLSLLYIIIIIITLLLLLLLLLLVLSILFFKLFFINLRDVIGTNTPVEWNSCLDCESIVPSSPFTEIGAVRFLL